MTVTSAMADHLRDMADTKTGAACAELEIMAEVLDEYTEAYVEDPHDPMRNHEYHCAVSVARQLFYQNGGTAGVLYHA